MALLADLSMLERVLITVATKHQVRVPTWATETVFAMPPQDPRTDCTITELHCVGLEGVLQYLYDAFVVHRGQYQLNDKRVYVSGKLHRFRTTFVRYEVEDGYPVENLGFFFEHSYLFVRVRMDHDLRWLSLFCFGRMRQARPRNVLRVDEDKLYNVGARSKPPPD